MLNFFVKNSIEQPIDKAKNIVPSPTIPPSKNPARRIQLSITVFVNPMDLFIFLDKAYTKSIIGPAPSLVCKYTPKNMLYNNNPITR